MRKMSLRTYCLVQVLIVVGAFGCSRLSPTQPTVDTPPPEVHQVVAEVHYIPLHDNIPATFVGGGGPVIWLCATQPRMYSDVPGQPAVLAEDHYLQYEPCPEVPIK